MTTTPGASEAMTAEFAAKQLRGACIDWDKSDMVDGEPPRDVLRCGDLRNAANIIDAQAAEIAALRAKTQICMGVGDGAGNLFVYGDHESIKAAQNIVLRLGESAREIAALKAELATARNDALEEAAKVCEAEGQGYHERFTAQPHQEVIGRLCESSREQASHYCARAIRALKGPTPQPAPTEGDLCRYCGKPRDAVVHVVSDDRATGGHVFQEPAPTEGGRK